MELDAALRSATEVPAAADAVLTWLEHRGAAASALLLHDGIATLRVVAWRGAAAVLDAVPVGGSRPPATAGIEGGGEPPGWQSVPLTSEPSSPPELQLMGLLRVLRPHEQDRAVPRDLQADARTAADRFTVWWASRGRPLPATPGRDLARFSLGVLRAPTAGAVDARMLAEATRVTGLRSGAVVLGTPTPTVRATHGPLGRRLAELPRETLAAVLAAATLGRIRYGGRPVVDQMRAEVVVRPSPEVDEAVLLVDTEPWEPSPAQIEHLDLLTGVAAAGLSALRSSTLLRDAEELFRDIVEQHPDVICIVEPNGRIRYVSPSCREVLGYTPAALRGRRASRLVHPDDRALVVSLMRDVLSGTRRTVRVTHRAPHSQGHVVWLESVAIGRRGPHGRLDHLQIAARDVSATKAETDRLGRLATEDHLTGLGNRAQLLQELRRTLDTATRATALLFLDLDDFKPINDRLGHAVGDQLLVQVAARLRHAVRPGDVVARFGGDEFVVLCPGIGGRRAAERLAARIVEVLSDPFALAEHELSVSASIGVALSSVGTGSAEALLADADAAMYRAKTSRRGGYAVADRLRPDDDE